MQLKLRVFWFNDFLGLAIDQKSINHLSPLTPYYIWPRTEAWEQQKVELDLKTWISKEDKVSILNQKLFEAQLDGQYIDENYKVMRIIIPPQAKSEADFLKI